MTAEERAQLCRCSEQKFPNRRRRLASTRKVQLVDGASLLRQCLGSALEPIGIKVQSRYTTRDFCEDEWGLLRKCRLSLDRCEYGLIISRLYRNSEAKSRAHRACCAAATKKRPSALAAQSPAGYDGSSSPAGLVRALLQRTDAQRGRWKQDPIFYFCPYPAPSEDGAAAQAKSWQPNL
jgi:hypothetical protein